MHLKMKNIIYVFVVSLCVFGLFTGCSPINFEPPAQQVRVGQQSEAYPAPLNQSLESEIEYYENILNQKELSAEDRMRVESLLAEAQEVATMVAAPAPSKEQIELDIIEYEVTVAEERIESTKIPELGILESGVFFEVHVPRQVKIENIWQGYVDGRLTRVYAGQLRLDYRVTTSVENDQKQFGAIYVMTFYSDGKTETNLYSTEIETGALRIQKATDDFLVLDSIGAKELEGKVFYYGLKEQNLVDSPREFSDLSTNTTNLDSYP